VTQDMHTPHTVPTCSCGPLSVEDVLVLGDIPMIPMFCYYCFQIYRFEPIVIDSSDGG
jgi:hypothetical protein